MSTEPEADLEPTGGIKHHLAWELEVGHSRNFSMDLIRYQVKTGLESLVAIVILILVVFIE